MATRVCNYLYLSIVQHFEHNCQVQDTNLQNAVPLDRSSVEATYTDLCNKDRLDAIKTTLKLQLSSLKVYSEYDIVLFSNYTPFFPQFLFCCTQSVAQNVTKYSLHNYFTSNNPRQQVKSVTTEHHYNTIHREHSTRLEPSLQSAWNITRQTADVAARHDTKGKQIKIEICRNFLLGQRISHNAHSQAIHSDCVRSIQSIFYAAF